jgi:hypothetical protein
MIKTNSNNLNLSSIGNLKYPTSRIEYAFHTGELGESVITTIVKNILPYTEIPYHNVVVNGSDLRIYYHGKLLAKFEILNFDSNSYINSRRAKNIRENLKNVKYKGLICSFFNATSKAREILKNIPICTIGFQLLPSKFHQYYARLNKVHHRRITNNRSLKQLKNTLKSFFHRIGLNLLMYASRSRISISDTINLKNTNLSIDVKNMETENKRARTEEKTNGSTLNDYTVPTSEEVTEKLKHSLVPQTKEVENMKLVVQDDQFLKKESHFGTTFNDKLSSLRDNPMSSETIRLETKEISFDLKEISPSRGEISLSKRLKIVCMNLLLQIKRLALRLWYDRSGNIGVKRIDLKEVLKREGEGVYMNGIRLYPLVSNPVFPCDYYSLGVVPYYDTKHCKHKGVIVCKLKHYKPFYVCRLLLLEKLQKFYQLKDNVFLCSKTVCKDSSSECPYRTIVCKHILKDKACPMIPKCYSKPLPEPKVLDSPDLTYYLNLSTS